MTTSTIPTLIEIRERMLADLDYRLPAARTRPVKSVLSVLVTVFSAAIYSLYAFGGWILKQQDPRQASEEWLTIWGERLDVPRQAATHAQGRVKFSGAGEITADAILHHVDSDARYRILNGGMVGEWLTIEAVDAGEGGNLSNADGNETLLLETPIAGVEIVVALEGALSGGAEQEALSAWVLRVEARLAERQKIGDADDYGRWALAAHPLISKAKTRANTPALGHISIYVLGDAKNPLLPDNVLQEAQASLDRTRNMGCRVNLLHPAFQVIVVRFADVPEVNRAALSEAVSELFSGRADFAAKLWPEEIERLMLVHAPGATLLEPLAKVTAGDYEILQLGEVNWA